MISRMILSLIIYIKFKIRETNPEAHCFSCTTVLIQFTKGKTKPTKTYRYHMKTTYSV